MSTSNLGLIVLAIVAILLNTTLARFAEAIAAFFARHLPAKAREAVPPGDVDLPAGARRQD